MRSCEEILYKAPVRRPRRSRDIRRSCIEMSHMGVKRSCRELLYRDVSYGGPVKRSCRELLYTDLS